MNRFNRAFFHRRSRLSEERKARPRSGGRSRVIPSSGASAHNNKPLRDTRGIAVTEFALILPVLMVLFMGVIDVTRYIPIVQKTEKLANTVANVTAQSATITKATLDQVFAASSDIMSPYSMGANGHIMVSSLYRDVGSTTQPTVNWRYEGGGTLSSTSKIGAVGAKPVMPGTFTFDERENVITAEVFYRFSPLLKNPWFGTTTIYRSAFYGPRFGALTTAPL